MLFHLAATVTNNLGQPLTTSSGGKANYHDTGSGEIIPLRALSPGLVFETTTQDYLYFMCYYGYKDQVIRQLSLTNFSCPAASISPRLISNMNYPSISIASLDSKRRPVMTVIRTATNVGPSTSTYTATVDAPAGMVVAVSPSSLSFAKRGAKATYEVKFDARGANKGYGFGSVTWSDGAHFVRTVFAVNVV